MCAVGWILLGSFHRLLFVVIWLRTHYWSVSEKPWSSIVIRGGHTLHITDPNVLEQIDTGDSHAAKMAE